MRIVFRPQARQEVLDAADWYRQRAPGLDRDFLLAVDAAVQAAASRPLAHPLVEDNVRRVLVKRFPYTVVFDALPDELVVIAVFQHRREPTAWRLRR
ncbi:MAG: type II toxin-antitoxin system RelE/ParE family toxin [Roseateles sp.]|uniref:type II toxin-antitoxin system RelE/ParE family toxin n=1 Tax=Roseateles sp. TaxID=1971397 RepID=UPI0039E7B030